MKINVDAEVDVDIFNLTVLLSSIAAIINIFILLSQVNHCILQKSFQLPREF